MYGSKAAHTAIINSLYSTYPQVHIRDYGVLDYDSGVDTSKCIGNLLCSKGVCCGACAYPDAINAMLKSLLKMLRCCNLGDYL